MKSQLENNHIRVHTYSGREAGTMIIGPASELKALAELIISSVVGKPERVEKDWPEDVLFCNVKSLEDIRSAYTLSFHVETLTGANPSPTIRNKYGWIIFYILGTFSIIGAITLIQWLMKLLGIGAGTLFGLIAVKV